MDITFPVGYYTLHKTKIIDFQLNRWHSLGYCRLEDMREAGRRIHGLEDWKVVMVELADQALAEGRILNAAFMYRAAEFFTKASDPDKLRLYEKFTELFYNELVCDEPLKRHSIPYEVATLPAFELRHESEARRGVLVMHGGFDSFIEEFYSLAKYFSRQGYDVYAFEGPGQGGALRQSGLPLTYQWEKPAKAVLDYFDLDDVSWLGISMGGWMCFRAAAFEPRISRVIASSIAYDYMEIPPAFVANFARWLMARPSIFHPLTELKMRMRPQEQWGIDNLIYITQSENALEASNYILEFNKVNQQPERVRQDVLILTGEDDHFIPMKLHHLQVKALLNARSITERIFTAEEQASNHCQVGNFGLALQVMQDWLHSVETPKRASETEMTPA
jgi:pimeloyl-ACP methyl ester carboxylesterase